MTAHLKSHDKFFEKMHQKATTKLKQVMVLFNIIFSRAAELSRLQKSIGQRVKLESDPIFHICNFSRTSNTDYHHSVANRTLTEVEKRLV